MPTTRPTVPSSPLELHGPGVANQRGDDSQRRQGNITGVATDRAGSLLDILAERGRQGRGRKRLVSRQHAALSRGLFSTVLDSEPAADGANNCLAVGADQFGQDRPTLELLTGFVLGSSCPHCTAAIGQVLVACCLRHGQQELLGLVLLPARPQETTRQSNPSVVQVAALRIRPASSQQGGRGHTAQGSPQVGQVNGCRGLEFVPFKSLPTGVRAWRNDRLTLRGS
jgi:hypothetical protein